MMAGKSKPASRKVKLGDLVRQVKKVDPETSGWERYVAERPHLYSCGTSCVCKRSTAVSRITLVWG